MKVTVIGSGAVGLTIAFRLAQNGVDVTVLEKGDFASKASWAGAGILPPANERDPVHPLDHLQSRSNQLHPELSRELKHLTGIDNEYRKCGGIYVARTAGEAASLQGAATLWSKQGIAFRWLQNEELAEVEGGFSKSSLQQITRSLYTPTEAQLRNPRHLKALLMACKNLKVHLFDHCCVTKIIPGSDQVRVSWQTGQLDSDFLCVATGAWTSNLVRDFSSVQVIPIKGHMLLYKLQAPVFNSIINEANRYIVCRQDGHFLVGSSEEESGLDESQSIVEISRLKKFAQSFIEDIGDQHLVGSWTGLRPMAFDLIPYIGPHSLFPNIFFATGHFRAGLHLSPATPELVCNQILGKPLPFDATLLRPER